MSRVADLVEVRLEFFALLGTPAQRSYGRVGLDCTGRGILFEAVILTAQNLPRRGGGGGGGEKGRKNQNGDNNDGWCRVWQRGRVHAASSGNSISQACGGAFLGARQLPSSGSGIRLSKHPGGGGE